MQKCQRELNNAVEDFEITANNLERAIADAGVINEQLSTSLREARAEIMVHEKTIGTLVQANKLLHERWGAEIANEVKKRVAAVGVSQGPEV